MLLERGAVEEARKRTEGSWQWQAEPGEILVEPVLAKATQHAFCFSAPMGTRNGNCDSDRAAQHSQGMRDSSSSPAHNQLELACEAGRLAGVSIKTAGTADGRQRGGVGGQHTDAVDGRLQEVLAGRRGGATSFEADESDEALERMVLSARQPSPPSAASRQPQPSCHDALRLIAQRLPQSIPHCS